MAPAMVLTVWWGQDDTYCSLHAACIGHVVIGLLTSVTHLMKGGKSSSNTGLRIVSSTAWPLS